MLHQSWIEGFDKTCQALLEDTLLLEALAAHICKQEMFSVSARAFKRLSDYLTQHAGDLRQLGQVFDPDKKRRPLVSGDAV